ncbi:alkaline phosphatase PhoX [Saccharopolyspora shandongensis]|uniref:alkaline phosphatase PhoX n=1 Tax=Saccharopolyspora shandongensis TaxID=418495 RepID=UPI0034237397
MRRRSFLRAAVIGGGVAAFTGGLWTGAAVGGPVRRIAESPYGPLLPADDNGLKLPKGFTSRVVAHSSDKVKGTSYTWHDAPDGGACFVDGDGWIYVSNSEVEPGGGVGAIKFDSGGNVTDAYRILEDTRRNCSGGATPWNTWLSCEEVSYGYVFETDPWGVKEAVRRDAMGSFNHEAAACDPVRKVIYLTEDEPDGCFYRFRPKKWGDLGAGGLLEVLVAGDGTSGKASWVEVPEPTPSEGDTPTREQVSEAKHFDGGEGCYYAADRCWFTTTGDTRVWQFNVADDTFGLAYDGDGELGAVDNLTGSSFGDLYVAEDGDNLEICIITPDDVVAPMLRMTGQDSSSLTGPAFNPAGDRMYFSSQYGPSGEFSDGYTYEISGPFRH